MDARAKQQAKEYAVQLKRAEVVKMRLRGMTYAEIVATGLYSSRSGAQQAFMAALKENYQEPTEAARLMEVARVEAMIVANWDSAINSKVFSERIKAGEFVLDLVARKCRILGIDAPAKVDIVGMLAPLVAAAGVDMDDAMHEIENLYVQHQQYGRA